ncbi:MAG: hypothetical protein V1770_04695 [bacterium]
MIIKSLNHQYKVGDFVGNANEYRLYLAIQEETEQKCLLQVATKTSDNGALDRAAYILRELKKHSDGLEEEYTKVKKNPDSFLNYDLGFPEIAGSFICQEQGGRRINILAFRSVESPRQMVPLNIITDTYGLRVDLRTTAWIMGKTLKMLDFAHSADISVNLMSSRNILVERDQHYVVIFDWSIAETHQGKIPREARQKDISESARAIIRTLGGDSKKGSIPNDGSNAYEKYTDYLFDLANGRESDAKRAHKNFYELVDSFWKKEFYPFTAKNLI